MLTLIKDNVESFLVALVMSMNILRFMLNIYDTNLLLYAIYVITAIVLLFKYNIGNVLRFSVKIRNIYYLNVAILFFAFVTLPLTFSMDTISTLVKFIVSTVIAGLCISIPIKKIKIVLYLIVFINLAYSVLLLLYPDRSDAYMQGDANYLNVTLTIGCALTICLAYFLYTYIIKNSLFGMAVSLSLSVFYFLILMRFAARGVLLFPPVIVLFLTTLFFKYHKLKTTIFIIILAIGLLFVFNYFMQNASDYVTGRFLRMFEDTEDESRVYVWKKSIGMIFDQYWFVLGGGINAFRENFDFYPHNIFIQYFGELGFLGIFSLIYCVVYVVKEIKSLVLYISRHKESITFICCFAGLLYYFLTFNKSFSIYDACPLQIMFVLTISTVYQLKNNEN